MLKSHFYKLTLFILTICTTLIAVSACFMSPATRVPITGLDPTASPSGHTDLIAYRHQISGQDSIKLLNPETLTETAVYTSSRIVQSPILSPKGDLLSFSEWTGKNNQFNFWFIDRYGSNPEQIADNIQVESLIASAKWSFDEKFLAYRASFNRLEPNETKMFVSNTTTTEVVCEIPNVWAFEWSPVDKVIAYLPWQDQQTGINLVKIDGCSSQSILLFDDQLTAFNPVLSWSPDGKWIAFAGRPVQESLTEIVLVNIESGEQKKLTNAVANNYISREIQDIKWSPDGKHILFRSTYEQQDGVKTRNELLIVDVDTGQEQKLAEQASYPVWSPVGGSIAFVTKLDDQDNEQIYEVEISTGNITKLTDTPGNKEFLSWR